MSEGPSLLRRTQERGDRTFRFARLLPYWGLVAAMLQSSCGGRSFASQPETFATGGRASDGAADGGVAFGGRPIGGGGVGGVPGLAQGGFHESSESVIKRGCADYCTAVIDGCGDAIADGERTADPEKCAGACESQIGGASVDCRINALQWIVCLTSSLSLGKSDCDSLPEWVALACDDQANKVVACQLTTPCVWRRTTARVLQAYCGTDLVESYCYWDESGRDPVRKCWCTLNGALVKSSSETAPNSTNNITICPEFFP